MAAIPTTLVLYSVDRVNLPLRHLYVVAKELFQYGIKEILEMDDSVLVSLTYCPRAITLKRKFGNLPVRYMRTKIQNDEEFKILKQVSRKFQYNLLDEELDPKAVELQQQQQHKPQLPQLTPGGSGIKRALTVEEVYSEGEEYESEEEQQQQQEQETPNEESGGSNKKLRNN